MSPMDCVMARQRKRDWRLSAVVERNCGAKLMNKFLAFILLILVAQATPMAWGQTAATRTRRAASLPSTCSPGGPSTPAETIIVDNVSYTCAATNVWKPIQGLEADNTWTNNNRFCGPIPWADVSCFGAHAPAGGIPSTTALCVKGNPQIVVADPNRFQVNDGVTIYGCGASHNMVTPADLKVTPSEPWGLADTRSPVSGPAANSSYEYTVVARDIYGGLTAPATPAEIKTGQASLGLQRAAIRTLTRKEDRITVVTTEPNKLVLGALVELEPKNSQQFGGWYNVAKVDSTTQFELWTTPTDTRGQGWMVGDTVSYSGGGTVAYYQ
jgi:hypothetical protein